MSNKTKYTVIGLVSAGVLSILLYFIIGGGSKEYQVTFDSQGGSVVETQKVKEGEKVSKPTDPTKEQYTFVAWLLDGVEYNFDEAVKSNLTLTAKWEEVVEVVKYDITFVVDGKEKVLSLSEITEASLEELGFEEKDGYEIKWYVDDKEYDISTPLTENMKLVGKYVKVSQYTIKFNSDGGTSVASQKLKLNEMVKEPDAITKEGYIFVEWQLDGKKYDFKTPVTKNITLKAKWEEDPNVKRYEVKFDSDGGSKVSTQRVIENKTATEPKKPTKSGYTFDGWYLNDTKYNFKTKVTKDITLKAKWIEDITYTVTFNTSGGTSIASQKIKKGEKVSKPTNPTRDGYKFVEWLLNNQTYDFNKEITKDITLVAFYQQLSKYTVTFDSDGGTSVSSQTITEGKNAVKPTNPSKTDNDFVEWQLDGKKYDFNTPVTKDIKLKAIWKSNVKYTISIDKVDNYSPSRIIKVYKNNSQITVKSIKAGSDGVTLCSGSNLTVDASEIENESTLIVVLNDGSEVRINVK